MKLIILTASLKTILSETGISFYIEHLLVKNMITTIVVWYHCLKSCQSPSSFIHHCFYITSAKVITVETTNYILVFI